ncbi:MAG: type II secretion system F family protein [Acidobacteria bacterium]|jgi:type IV pilus assembly protein PilC|nr:type II secretion system F family protein [Acidobacteriota bacterium]
MPIFRCRLATTTGEIVDREFEATEPGTLRRELERQEFLVLSIQKRSSLGAALGGLVKRRRSVKMSEFLFFNQEFVALIRAGLPIVECLTLLIERRQNPVFKAALEDVRNRVRTGEALSDAFAAQGVFPPLFASTVASGERSGEIATVLQRYVTYSKTLLSVRKKVLAALTYPAILIALSVVLVVVLLVYVLPNFQDFFSDFGADLPLITRAVMGASQLIRQWWFVWLGVVLGGSALLAVWRRTPTGQRALEALVYQLPVVGSIARKFVVTRFARTLGTLVSGGIPMVTGLEIVSRAIGTPIYGQAIARVAGKIREGAALWSSLEETGLFPDMLIEMVKVGESSGTVAEMLDHVGNFTDEEIEHELQTLVSLVEPALLVGMAVVVGLLLFSIYYPLLQVVGNLGT